MFAIACSWCRKMVEGEDFPGISVPRLEVQESWPTPTDGAGKVAGDERFYLTSSMGPPACLRSVRHWQGSVGRPAAAPCLRSPGDPNPT